MNDVYDYGMWAVALFNVGLFVFFAFSFLTPQGRVEWRNFGAVTAFFVALFTEMYGFPLTIYLLTAWFGDAYPVLQPFSHKFGHLWVVVFGGSDLAWALVMAISLMLLLTGYLLLSKGWRLVHGTEGRLVTGGVYSFARHPQYTGLFLIINAFLVQSHTMLTVLMAPVLVAAYVHLARREEVSMRARFGEQYDEYARRVPGFIPPISCWGRFLTASPARSEGKL
mgnify:FL=1